MRGGGGRLRERAEVAKREEGREKEKRMRGVGRWEEEQHMYVTSCNT